MQTDIISPIHILFVEDTIHDMELAIRELKRENLDFVSTELTFNFSDLAMVCLNITS